MIWWKLELLFLLLLHFYLSLVQRDLKTRWIIPCQHYSLEYAECPRHQIVELRDHFDNFGEI